jgi:hypothetical protein
MASGRRSNDFYQPTIGKWSECASKHIIMSDVSRSPSFLRAAAHVAHDDMAQLDRQTLSPLHDLQPLFDVISIDFNTIEVI